MTKLKSADHIAAIIDILDKDSSWAKEHIWNHHKDDEEYEEYSLPDLVSKTPGDFIIMQIGRKGYRTTGNKLYVSEADYWKKAFSHWPRMPTKKSHWKRDYRRVDKATGIIERRYDLFVHPIYAVTKEKDDEIVSVEFFDRYKDTKLYST